MPFNLSELQEQIDLLGIEIGLEPEEIIKSIGTSLAGAYRKEFGDKDKAYEGDFNSQTGKYTVYEVTHVVEEVLNPAREISLVEARLSDPSAQIGDNLRKAVVNDSDMNFGRIASQVAKQVLRQSISNVKHTKILQQFKDKIGDVINVEVDFSRKGGYIVKFAQTSGFMAKENLLPTDRFKPGQTIKALIVDISEDERGNSRLLLSRTHPDFIRAIIAKEVPEVEAGIVVIDKIAREAGVRSKILVSAPEDENVDPVGTILGRKNVRIINIMREISITMSEKIDVVENRPEELEEMIMDALEPAEIERIEFDRTENKVNIFCYPEEASLAVGRRGVNVRLASELLDMEISINSIEEKTEGEATVTQEVEEEM
jgi:transcription termination/antitermination protein NusA